MAALDIAPFAGRVLSSGCLPEWRTRGAHVASYCSVAVLRGLSDSASRPAFTRRRF